MVTVLVSAAACARTLDGAGLEDQIATLLEDRGGVVVSDVACPADVPVETGATFECEVLVDGDPWVVLVTQRDDQGNVDVELVHGG